MENFSQTIIKELEARGATPKPRLYFLFTRGLLLVLSLISAIVGGVAFSVGWYVFFDNDGLHATLGNIFRIIPYVWILVLIAFVILAYFGFKHTRKGYKYDAKWVFGLILLTSIVLGMVFDIYDIGQKVHKFLLNNTNFYNAIIHSSEDENEDETD